tara:strand:+ start:167 stop:517 length:351 start_codon:yes stop_codon:yes gene_type:complete
MTSEPQKISPIDLNAWINRNKELPVLVDVREYSELEMAAFSFEVVHLPLSKAEDWMKSLPDYLPIHRPIVVICHAGVRSWNFGVWLLDQGWESEVWNLEGGIDAWSVNVDPNIPRY